MRKLSNNAMCLHYNKKCLCLVEANKIHMKACNKPNNEEGVATFQICCILLLPTRRVLLSQHTIKYGVKTNNILVFFSPLFSCRLRTNEISVRTSCNDF